MIETGYPKLTLHPGKDRSLRNRHPWVFSGAIKSKKDSIQEGTLVEVFDCDGNYLATGHFHHGTIMVRVISFNQRVIDQHFWNESLQAALDLRATLGLIKNSQTDAYRLIHGEGDDLPGLVIDIYGDCAVVQAHSEGMRRSLDAIGNALRNTPLQLNHIYNKSAEFSDQPADHPNGWLLGQAESSVVFENGRRFHVNWKDGQKTGFFLDQRDNRSLLASYVKEKNVLNTFCYSGGFSIYALTAGAKHVTSIDSSKKAIEWIQQNVELNKIAAEKHQAICDDVSAYLKNVKNDEYEVIILDPPAYAKHLSAIDRAVVGYRNINELAIRKIKAGGMLFTFSCSQAIDKQLFRKTVFMAAAKTGRRVRILHQLSQGADHPINLFHPEGEYLKGLVLVVD
jgi:23S rRNA (cytosine1962-C5)-methyltransferase